MQTRQDSTANAARGNATKPERNHAPARLTIVRNDRQDQTAQNYKIPSREEAVRAAMLRTG